MSRILVAVTVLVALSGCPGSNGGFVGHIYDDGGCQVGCDRCAPMALCVSAPYKPACLAQCSSNADCNIGQTCARLNLPEQVSSVCLNADSLPTCETLPACNLTPQCQDAQTLLTPLPFSARICGWAVTPCDSGCDFATAKCK